MNICEKNSSHNFFRQIIPFHLHHTVEVNREEISKKRPGNEMGRVKISIVDLIDYISTWIHNISMDWYKQNDLGPS